MDKHTLQALRDSIEKWRQIERGEMPDLGDENCMLCARFLPDANGEDCVSCPVFPHTEHEGYCRNTPYARWRNVQAQREQWLWVANTPELMRLARVERKFLESLLPKRKQ